ncbi:VOC family protein [Paenibacillus xanthanilyticus]|uniref:VOC family protein n=1 Tax=Paenibacillus xanthanilyticus TaxID=1783531 RepID=A0ABV8K122_9BACL
MSSHSANANQPAAQPKIGSVLIKTSDMSRSVAWYHNLLGLSVPEAPFSPIVSIPLENTILLLDSIGDDPVSPSPHALFAFDSDNIDRSLKQLERLGVRIVGEGIERFPDVAFITVQDPDGHRLMIVQSF